MPLGVTFTASVRQCHPHYKSFCEADILRRSTYLKGQIKLESALKERLIRSGLRHYSVQMPFNCLRTEILILFERHIL